MSNFLIKVLQNLFWLILELIHFTYSGYEYFDLGLHLLKRKCKNFYDLDSPQFVSEFMEKLEKCPSHLVVVVGKDGINLRDFSNLVIWSLAAKISFVSFYDCSGYLKANEHNYYKYLMDNKKVDQRCLIFDLAKLNMKNGVIHKIHLNILSPQDGKPLFVEVIKKLSQNVISKKLNVADINETLISSELHKFNGLPEPDLGIISGKVLSTFGFLPWQIRVTEFLQIRSLNGIKASEFTSLLLAYSNCSQRFGK